MMNRRDQAAGSLPNNNENGSNSNSHHKTTKKKKKKSWFDSLFHHRAPGTKLKKSPDLGINANISHPGTIPQVPTMIWTHHIFPYLMDRGSQNQLAAAHREIALARRHAPLCHEIKWPNIIRPKPSRLPIKKLLFWPNDDTLLMANGNDSPLCYHKLHGPSKFTDYSKSATPKMNGVVQCSANGDVLAVASKKGISLWNQCDGTNSAEERVVLAQPRAEQLQSLSIQHMVTWSPDGRYLVWWNGSDTGTMGIGNVFSGWIIRHAFWKTRMEVIGCHETVAFAPNSRQVAFALNNEEIVLWNFAAVQGTRTRRLAQGGRDLRTSYAGAYITSLAYATLWDGDYLLVGCHVATIKMYKLTAKVTTTTDTDDDDYDYTFVKEVYLGRGWSAVTLMTIVPPPAMASSSGAAVSKPLTLHKGDEEQQGNKHSLHVACTNNGTQIRIVNLQTEEIVLSLTGTGHKGRIESLAITSDGRTLASGSRDKTVRLWDISNVSLRYSLLSEEIGTKSTGLVEYQQ